VIKRQAGSCPQPDSLFPGYTRTGDNLSGLPICRNSVQFFGTKGKQSFQEEVNGGQFNRRVARGNFTPRPSRNRTLASRLIRLLSISQIGLRCSLKAPPLQSRVDPQVKLIDPTPSLHPHYGASPLLQIGPTLCFASLLSPLWVLHLGFSLIIGTPGSQVPCKSLNQVRAIFMPDAARAVRVWLHGISGSLICFQFFP